MIEFNREYSFTNDLGEFTINAKTIEHPTQYGNGMMLIMVPTILPELFSPHDLTHQYDIRYNDVRSAEDIHELAMRVLEQNYGVTEAESHDTENKEE